jgi:PAT family beta-lactamase induction signal transducer AmpG
LVTLAFVLAFIYLNFSQSLMNAMSPFVGDVIAKFSAQILRISISLAMAVLTGYLITNSRLVNRDMVIQTYVNPVLDFFSRYRQHAVIILLLIGLYRTSDIVLGVITNVFYEDMGFSLQEIASYTKVFGVIMTIFGGFVGGVITTRFGVMRILLIGAVLVVVTNLLFMVLAIKGHNTLWLGIVIAADNMSAGVATAAFIAYLSSLTNISFTAIQYAIFSSLMTLVPKTIGGYSGSMVDQLGYQGFFIVAAILGLPAILLVLYLMTRHTDKSDTG